MDELSTLLRALEERLITTDVRTDANVLELLLTHNFVEVGSSGRTYTRQEIVEQLAVEVPRRISLHEFACQPLSSGAALVTYRSRSEAGEALRSSVWIYRDHRWQMLFHQGTKSSPPPGADAVS